VEAQIAARVKAERENRGWSLAELADKSGVSKAMLSKIERQDVSPTAVILVRIATAFGRSLAELVSVPSSPERLVRRKDQPEWRDPATNYLRRQIFLAPDTPMELVEVFLPRGAKVAFPASSYAHISKQVIWLLSGRLEVGEGEQTYVLEEGDRLEFGPPADRHLRNPGTKTCHYVVAVLRR
jgi:transcriptional regulator with XRE-family HTH domain